MKYRLRVKSPRRFDTEPRLAEREEEELKSRGDMIRVQDRETAVATRPERFGNDFGIG